MATTNGKGTTPISTFVALGKEVDKAEQGRVSAWRSVHAVFVKDGWTDMQAFAKAFVRVNKKWRENTVRQNISLIKWADENVKGGAKACPSMKHIEVTRAGDKPKAKPAKPRRVSTRTGTDVEFQRELRKAGLSAEVIAIATKAWFTTAK